MNAIRDNSALDAVLNKVGLTSGEPVTIAPSTIASTWVSDYAELYVVDAHTLTPIAIADLLKQLDSVVAKRLRDQRDAGKSVDAHVCIMVANDLISGDQLIKEADASRYVSRKYWIDRTSPVDEILRRLTLTWVDVEAMAQGAAPLFSQEFSDLRERIAKRMGSGAATDFIEAQTE